MQRRNVTVGCSTEVKGETEFPKVQYPKVDFSVTHPFTALRDPATLTCDL